MKKIVQILFISIFTFGLAFCNLDSQKIQAAQTVNAAHILVGSKAEADAIKKRIDNGENFRVLAKEYSKCPSGQEGGMLGSFGKGQMVLEFEKAAFSMPAGAVSEPIQTQFGWHIIKVYSKN